MTSGLLTDLTHVLAGKAAEMEARLADYARLETPTGDIRSLGTFADVVSKRYRELGGVVQRVSRDGGDVIVVDFEQAGNPDLEGVAMLLGHYDTVHEIGTVPVRSGPNTLTGPGVYDMKGGLVVAETAIAALAEVGMSRRALRIVLTPDEEIGSPNTRDVVAAQALGVSYVLGLEPPHPDGALKSSRHGSTRLRITAHGRSSHAALAPEEGVNAINELCEQLARARALIAEFPDVLVNVGTISGGGRTNVVPDIAYSEIGLRFQTAEDEAAVLERLSSLPPVLEGSTVETLLLSSRSPWAPNESAQRLLSEVQAAGEAVGMPVKARPSTGSADTNLTGAMGVPTLDGFGPIGAGAHALDEEIQLDSLPERAVLLASILSRV